MIAAPALSVIIASLSGSAYLDACLAALTQQEGDIATEIIVAHPSDPAVADLVRQKYPAVRLIALPPPRTLAELRAAGLDAASGDIVALTEDHCVPSPDWFVLLLALHQAQPAAAIGGAVDNAATERLVDRFVYAYEYGPFTSPAAHGPVEVLPGPNVSYKRVALQSLRQVWPQGFDEGRFHDTLRSAGFVLWSEPALRVWHKKHFTLLAFLRERFHYSRWFAGRRITGPHRLLYLAATPFLPLLLTVRVVRRRGRVSPWWLFLPFAWLASWVAAVGEMVGYLSGPGDSAYHLR